MANTPSGPMSRFLVRCLFAGLLMPATGALGAATCDTRALCRPGCCGAPVVGVLAAEGRTLPSPEAGSGFPCCRLLRTGPRIPQGEASERTTSGVNGGPSTQNAVSSVFHDQPRVLVPPHPRGEFTPRDLVVSLRSLRI